VSRLGLQATSLNSAKLLRNSILGHTQMFSWERRESSMFSCLSRICRCWIGHGCAECFLAEDGRRERLKIQMSSFLISNPKKKGKRSRMKPPPKAILLENLNNVVDTHCTYGISFREPEWCIGLHKAFLNTGKPDATSNKRSMHFEVKPELEVCFCFLSLSPPPFICCGFNFESSLHSRLVF